ncbi:MAG: DUF4139 domain-containing protein, partial [Planctomycetes bacterium]|nr:DUF4139 domain-containing protein [Planctomycetota bacterium]
PAYQVDLTDPQRLGLRQSAVIRNELEDLQDVEVELVSGFPSMVFSHVLSPLAADTTWSAFFQQLNQRFQTAGPLLTNVATQMAYHGESGPSDTAAAALVGERADLHYQPIGRITLAEGESLHLDTAAADAPYERIVEWNIPDTRDEYGAHYRDYQRQQRPELGDDEPWDAVRFTNPFAMPMTTAAATMVAGGRFLGQQMSMWVNPGQRTSLRITKALSITARHGEQENADDPRDYILLGGKRFRQIAVQGTVELTNRRDRPVTMVIRRRFSGQLQTADAEPELTLLEGGVYSVNQRNELTWEIDLAPKEVRTLTYRYQVYVYH